ncbi:MAG: HlyD family efflux transporter periplasmic adaptor subunit [Gemmatimonadaceae bacterium]|nr:HlyD family efflux transporter periplasmic adaptor subunit [Gemmatimonadaceae bacterium]
MATTPSRRAAPAEVPRDILSDHEHLESAKLLVTPASHRLFYRIVIGTLVVFVASMFLPWQQFVEGKGEVTAFSPADRPQVVPSTIGGRIVEWYVQEGQVVKAGDPLLRITEVKDDYLDPQTIDRYNEQLTGKSSAVTSKREKVRQLELQIGLLERNLRLGEQKARTKVAQYEADVRAAVIDSATALAQWQRQQALLDQELVRLTDVENARVKYQNAVAKLQEKRQALQAAQIELDGVAVDYGEKIAKARSEAAATMAEVGEGSADVAKLRQNVRNLEIRNGFYVVRAPQAGTIVRAARAGIGEQLKEGETVVTIMPAAAQQAVALLVKPMDVPLLSVGRKVRLQFDGWPALQFAGWPSVSVGTFGGTVAVIDRVPDAAGQFRVLVVPDSTEEAWPRQLRLGSGVLGWAMLDQVRVGFELWRRVNGFPPSLRQPSDDAFGGAKSGTK